MFLWCILLNFDLLRQSLSKTECDRRNINPDRKIEYELKNKRTLYTGLIINFLIWLAFEFYEYFERKNYF